MDEENKKPYKRKSKAFINLNGYKKRIKCKSCNEVIWVKNFNQYYCDKCGYRGS